MFPLNPQQIQQVGHLFYYMYVNLLQLDILFPQTKYLFLN